MRPRVRYLLIAANIFVVLGLSIAVVHFTQSNNAGTDRIAIENLINQYAYLWDSKDSDRFADLFTEDAVMERWVSGELQSRIEGRDAIKSYAAKSHGGRLADRQTRHHMSGIVFVELTSGAAATQNMVLITHQTASDPVARIASSGVYRKTWQKDTEGWKITKRVLLVDRFGHQ